MLQINQHLRHRKRSFVRIHQRFGVPLLNAQPANSPDGNSSDAGVCPPFNGGNISERRAMGVRTKRVRFSEALSTAQAGHVLPVRNTRSVNMGRTSSRRVQHSVLDKPERYLRDRTTRGASSPPVLRKGETGGFSNSASGANPRYPRRQGRRMMPIPGDGDGRGILGEQPHSVVRTNRSKSANSPMHSNSNISDMPVSKRARLMNLPRIKTRSELSTSLENTPGGVDFSQAKLFTSQPNANF